MVLAGSSRPLTDVHSSVLRHPRLSALMNSVSWVGTTLWFSSPQGLIRHFPPLPQPHCSMGWLLSHSSQRRESFQPSHETEGSLQYSSAVDKGLGRRILLRWEDMGLTCQASQALLCLPSSQRDN